MDLLQRLNIQLYFLVANHLPSSLAIFGSLYKKLRGRWAKKFISYCGENVNIEPNCSFGTNLKIGDNSGGGQYSEIHGDVTLGKNVMMGPYCLIYTQNHSSAIIEVPMIGQVFDTQKHVLIDDDVWIGGRVIISPGVHINKGCIVGAESVVTPSLFNCCRQSCSSKKKA